MRRLVTTLVLAALALTACSPPPADRPSALIGVFELQRHADGRVATDLLFVDPATGSVEDTIALGEVVDVSTVSSATGIPKLVVAERDRFRELNLDTMEWELLATVTAGMEPLGAGHTRDGSPVLWEASPDGAQFQVIEVAGGTVRRAYADLSAPPLGAPENAETAIRGPMMLLAADDAQAVFVNARVASELPAVAGATVYRAAFLEQTVVQLSPTKDWPTALPPYEDVRVEEAVRRWGVPAPSDRAAVAFLGLDGKQRAAIETVPATGEHPDVVFQPGGETYLTLESLPVTATPPPVRVMERSMYGEASRTLMASEPVQPIRPVAVLDGRFAYATSKSAAPATGRVFELRVAETGGDRQRTVVSLRVPPGEGYSVAYLGAYEPQRRP